MHARMHVHIDCRYAASVEIGLARYQGQQGTEALAELMIARYGWISREALKQLAFLFSLLDEYQYVCVCVCSTCIALRASKSQSETSLNYYAT